MSIRLRAVLLGGFGTVLGRVALISAAYACTWMNGSVVARACGAGSSPAYAQGGNNAGTPGLGYCNAWGTAGNQVVGTIVTNNGTTLAAVTFTGAGPGGNGVASCNNGTSTITTYACPWQVDLVTGHDCANANKNLQETWEVNWMPGQWETKFGELKGADCMNTSGTPVVTGLASYSTSLPNLNMSATNYTNGYFNYTTPAFTPALGTTSVCLTNTESYNDIPQVTFNVT